MLGRVHVVPLARRLFHALTSPAMGEIVFRTADSGDLAVLIDLRERMLRELGSDDAGRLAQLAAGSLVWLADAFSTGGATGWVAERDGQVVGGVLLVLSRTLPQYRSPGGRTASLLGLYVMPAERGAGIATRLVRDAVKYAREWGAEVVLLHAANKARPLYERLGFTATKEMRLQFSEHDAPASGDCCM